MGVAMTHYTRGITTCYRHGNRMPCSKCVSWYKEMHDCGDLDRIADKVMAEIEEDNDV